MDPLLELEGVTVRAPRLGAGDGLLLRDLSFRVRSGERWSLIGRSGSGKSTLLRVMNRFLDPVAGQIRFRGKALAEYPPAQVRRAIALIMQELVWLPGTARDNLMASVALGLTPSTDAETRLPEVLALSGVRVDWMDREEDALSVGQRQRVALARALIAEPDILLLDEPTSALDPPSAAELMTQLGHLGERSGLTMIMVTHRLDDARRFGEHTALLDEGRIAAQGPTREVLASLHADWGENGAS